MTNNSPNIDGKALVVERVFNNLFSTSPYHTVLRRGGDEPIYQPRLSECEPNLVLYAHGFCSSALHEVAHWCLAGKERRKQEDYGYWYQPDGRDLEAQRDFERVEARPQALEWIFSVACGIEFFVSADNLTGSQGRGSLEDFRRRVRSSALNFLHLGLPSRARKFHSALVGEFASQELGAVYWERVKREGVLPH